MKKQNLIEIIIGTILIILVLAFLDPFMVLMPNALIMMVMLLLVIGFSVFSVYIWREQAKDEREELHRLAAGRYAWLVGSGIIILGILYQGFIEHQVDHWLIYALVGMITTKLVTRSFWEAKY
jgi:hypothetical protein